MILTLVKFHLQSLLYLHMRVVDTNISKWVYFHNTITLNYQPFVYSWKMLCGGIKNPGKAGSYFYSAAQCMSTHCLFHMLGCILISLAQHTP